MSIKALANKVLERNSQGNRKETPSFPDRKLDPPEFPCKETGNSLYCFDPDGLLTEAMNEAIALGWTDDRLLDCIEELIREGCLQTPWGFKVKGSPVVKGDYWIISGPEARGKIPAGATSFTLDELKPLVETSKAFPGAKVVKIKGNGGLN